MNCPTCGGTGKWPTYRKLCPVCNATGTLPNTRVNNALCVLCTGTGKYPTHDNLCPKCEGWGRLPPETKEIIALIVEAGLPRTAHLQLSDLLEGLRGEVWVCDPYYGTASLLRLDELRNCGPIRFLTCRPDNKEAAFITRALKEFVSERPRVEFRRIDPCNLHDRYLLTDDEIIILGHGLKDIGGKQSFVVRLSKTRCEDLMRALRFSFEENWKRSVPLV